MFGKLIDMARTPDEVKEELATYATSPSSSASVAKYPYGLCISLDEDSLEKLGLSGDLPDVGDMIPFQAIAKVTSANTNEREKADGKTEVCKRVELQIIQMSAPVVDEAERQVQRSQDRRKKFYGEMGSSSTD